MHPEVPQESSGREEEEKVVADKQRLIEEKHHVCEVRGAIVLCEEAALLQSYNGSSSRGVFVGASPGLVPVAAVGREAQCSEPESHTMEWPDLCSKCGQSLSKVDQPMLPTIVSATVRCTHVVASTVLCPAMG